ncbi:MAG: phosphatase PAP2 family protein [Herminiimonas sp.]|nr:phosphatase PAP2 family protein [Herminiimonas sp.]
MTLRGPADAPPPDNGRFPAVHSRAWWARHGLMVLALLFGVAAPLYLFGSLAEDVVEQDPFFFDAPVLHFMHAHATPVLDAVMVFFAYAGSARVMVPFNILVLVILLFRRDRMGQMFWLAATVGAALINLMAKNAFSRVRPALWISILPETTFSFPSGHAMQTMAVMLALVILLWHTRWRWAAIVLGTGFVVWVGACRVYLGVHYPSDVLAGWTASVAWVAGLAAVLQVRRRRAAGQRAAAAP